MTEDTFRAALLDARRPVPDGLIDGAEAPAGKRFSVYRNNVAVSLTDALRTGFPILRKLLGEQNFDALAGLHLRAHPPETPLMMHYGQAMPEFLEGFAPLAHLGYLPDIARLELALRRAYHAADATPIKADSLGRISPERLTSARLQLAPAVQVLRSAWPIHDIWLLNTRNDAQKPRAVAQDVVVLRPGFDPAPHLLAPGAATWITAIRSGATLGAAQDAAETAAPGFDLAPLLGCLLENGALAKLIDAKENA